MYTSKYAFSNQYHALLSLWDIYVYIMGEKLQPGGHMRPLKLCYLVYQTRII